MIRCSCGSPLVSVEAICERCFAPPPKSEPALSVSGEPTSKARLHVCQTQGGWWSVRIHGPELWEQLDDGSPRWAEIEIGRGDTEAGARQDAQQWLASFPSGVSVEPIRDWQPIETAPKEKYAHFLVAGGRQWPVVAYRFEDRLFLEYGGGQPVIGATHWMPLPVPPAIPTTEEERRTDECSYHAVFDGWCAKGTYRCPDHHPVRLDDQHQGLRGTFTDADLKAAGQDWGERAPAIPPEEAASESDTRPPCCEGKDVDYQCNCHCHHG